MIVGSCYAPFGFEVKNNCALYSSTYHPRYTNTARTSYNIKLTALWYLAIQTIVRRIDSDAR
jgi:hypothetical protein